MKYWKRACYYVLNESRTALWTQCLTERNVLTLSSATIKKFYEPQHLKKATNILKSLEIFFKNVDSYKKMISIQL